MTEMGRRKVLIKGSGGKFWFNEALGYGNKESFLGILRDGDPLYELDFQAIETKVDARIDDPSRRKLNDDFVNYYIWTLERLIDEHDDGFSDMYGAPISRDVSKSEFQKLVVKLERTAAELLGLVDQLADINPPLVCRPSQNARDDFWPTSLAERIDDMVGSVPPWHDLSRMDFGDYVGFRRNLDYLASFQKINARFNNWYDRRYTEVSEHSDFDIFLRRVIVHLRQDGFPCSVTIPTDTNPGYESPLVVVLLEIQRQVFGLFEETIDLDQMSFPRRNYRQMAYLALQVIDETIQLEKLYSSIRP